MGFPLNVSFRPYLVLRNTTGRALPVALRLNRMEGEAPRTVALPTQVLAPAETRRVHLSQLMDRAGLGDFDGSVNLFLSFNGRAGDLVPAAGSMDETHNYVFEVPPQGAAPTSGREAITWQLRAGFDTMLTLWNWGEKAEDIVATFYYGDGTGKYELPEHLAAGASATIDLMQLAESGQPDASGQTFSMSPGYGSATFETADGKHGWMDLAEAAGVYNPVTATCGVVCVTCCGYGSVGIDPNQLILQLQADGYPVADGEYCDGTVTDFSGTWSSSDTRIATVAAGGPPVQGVGVGQADVTAYLTNVPVNAGQICAATAPSCPPPYNPEPTGGVAVTQCGDPPSPTSGDRGALIQEYQTYGVALTPACSDFTNNASTAHSTFSELNSGDYTWAILRSVLLTGIEATRADNGGTALAVTSGYRNPAHNAAVGGASQSQHMYGTAIDFGTGGSESTWTQLRDAAWNAGACVEPNVDLSNPYDHVHADWRSGGCPAGWGANGGGSGPSGSDL